MFRAGAASLLFTGQVCLASDEKVDEQVEVIEEKVEEAAEKNDYMNNQSKKNKRKRNLIKKAHELAVLGNIKVTVVIMDE